MSSYKFSKLIKCKSCGKNFRGKDSRGKNIYVCSGRANYGKDFCHNIERIVEEDLIFAIGDTVISEIKQIIVDKDDNEIIIEFKNGHKKIWSNLGLQFKEKN